MAASKKKPSLDPTTDAALLSRSRPLLSHPARILSHLGPILSPPVPTTASARST